MPTIHLAFTFSLKTIVDISSDKTTDKWFGVTYKEDKDYVIDSFKKLIADGVYSEKLFG